jgi:hypothetical protein
MKKLVLLLVCAAAVCATAKADNDKAIGFEQLPAESRQMIKKHFPGQPVALVKQDCDFLEKTYEVIFTNSNKVEFDKKGVWKEINCKYTEMPAALVPEQIAKFVGTNYPGQRMIKIERKSRNRHEIELANGLEVEFDANFTVIDIDD